MFPFFCQSRWTWQTIVHENGFYMVFCTSFLHWEFLIKTTTTKNRKKEIQFSCRRNLFLAFPVLLQIQDLSVIGQVAHSKLITLCSRTSNCCKLWSCSFGTISFERRNEWMKFHFPPRILVINSKNTSGEIKKKKKIT